MLFLVSCFLVYNQILISYINSVKAFAVPVLIIMPGNKWLKARIKAYYFAMPVGIMFFLFKIRQLPSG